MEKLICTNCGAENTLKVKYCVNCGHKLPIMVQEKTTVDVFTPTPKKKNNYKIVGVIIVGILILVALLFGIRSFVTSFVKKNGHVIYDKALSIMADELNKSCPVMIDEFTRLDSVSALANKKFQYNYTVLENDFSQIPTDTLKKYINENVLHTSKTSSEMKAMRDLKTTFIYSYKNDEGKNVYKFVITPEMYK